MTNSSQSERCSACGVSKQQILRHHNGRVDELQAQLTAMTEARDLCKRQTGGVEELRQWQVTHAEVALQAIVAHGSDGVWTAKDCATHAQAAIEAMRRPVGEPAEGMRDG